MTAMSRAGLLRAVFLAVGGLAVVACRGPGAQIPPLPALPRPSVHGPALARIQHAGVLRVAIDLSEPPLAFRRQGVPQGLEVDLAGVLASALGVRVEVVDTPAAVMETEFPVGADLVEGLPRGRAPGIPTDSYYEVGQAVLWRDRMPVPTASALRGKRTGVVVGSPGEALAKAEGAVLVLAFLPEEAAALVDRGAADAAVSDVPPLVAYAAAHPRLGVTDLPGPKEPLTVAARPDEPDVAAFVTSALRELRRSGGLDQLRRRWGL